MQLVCPECNTRYQVGEAALSGGGRTVRCAQCGHSWFQAPVAPAPEKPAPPQSAPPSVPAPETSRRMPHFAMPQGYAPIAAAVMQPAATPRWLKVLCVALLTLAVVLAPFAYHHTILRNYPALALLFEPLGIYSMDGLAIADVSVTKTPADNHTTHVAIHCNVINEAHGGRTLPELAVALLSVSGWQTGSSPNLIDTGDTIPPGGKVPCRPFAFDAKGDEVDRARIDLAGPFDRRLRLK